MDKATWDEIKLLASDFKRAQATSTNLKLSERNCIDIIQYLINSNRLSLYFTIDGKTFLTPEELRKEIYEELDFSNGRVSLSSLSNSLDIDLSIIESNVAIMIQNDSELQNVMNNLINSSYIRQIALKINEILKNRGRSSIGELNQLFELPKLFIDKLVINNLLTVIDAHKDGDMVYTNGFVRRHKAMIRGYLTRSSKSIPISLLTQKYSIPEKLILNIITELLDENRLFGKLDNGKLIFIPEIYLKNQKIYVREFFSQNNYLEFSTMKDVGVQNCTKFSEIEFPEALILSSCILSKDIVTQLEAAVHECNRCEGFISAYESIPSIVNERDIDTLINNIIKPFDNLKFIGTEFIVSNKFIDNSISFFDELIKVKSEEFVKNKKKLHSEKSLNIEDDEDSELRNQKLMNKSIKIKSGGGQRGREIKNKTVKNKYGFDKKVVTKTKEENISLEFIEEDEAIDLLRSKMEDDDVPIELLQKIFNLIQKQLEFKFKKECRSVILQTSDTAKMKENHQKMENDTTLAINKIKLFEKGILEIKDVSLRNDLIKYCLKSVCSNLINTLFEFIARDNDLEWDDIVTNESKSKLINQAKSELANKMKALNKALKEDTLDEFYTSFDNLTAYLDLFPKPLDKKNEKRLIQEIGANYHSILDKKAQNNEDIDPADLLLITTLLLFQRIVGFPLNASGKFVPDILNYLQNCEGFSETIDWVSLKIYQNFIISSAKMSSSQESLKLEFKINNKELHEKILELALNWKFIKSL